MQSILEVRNLSKKYGDFTAVKGISFDSGEGEIFSLLGPNGAGKTTTISMLSTLYDPTGGDAMIGGHLSRFSAFPNCLLMNGCRARCAGCSGHRHNHGHLCQNRWPGQRAEHHGWHGHGADGWLLVSA